MTGDALRTAILVAATLVLAGCGILDPDPDPWGDRSEALDRNRAVWQAAGIDAYRYTLERLCYCSFFGVLNLTVVDDSVVAATGHDDTPLAENELHYLETVDDLFDRIERAIENRAYRFEARYDPELGYPTLIDLDPDRHAIDEEIRYEARGLVVLDGS